MSLFPPFLIIYLFIPCLLPKEIWDNLQKKRKDEDNKQTKKMAVEMNQQTEPKGLLWLLVIKHKFGSEHPGSQGKEG